MTWAAGRKRFRRDTTGLAARLRVITFVCEHCGLWAGSDKPKQCVKCGGMAFLRFDSRAEATRWAELCLLRDTGQIAELRRQVRYPLNAEGGATVGHYVADFVYTENDLEVREDLKGNSITDLAAWKLRHMEAQGQPVKLVKA